MAEERHVPGSCRCGQRVTRVLNSKRPTMRSDRSRFIYTEREDKGWGIFRCDSCYEVIDLSWKPLPDQAVAHV